MELKDKVAIVTGSARGIGEGIAVAFAREGAKVVVNGLDAASCEETVGKIKAAGGTAIGVGADVSKAADVEAMVAATIRQFGGVDILVNNAGIERTPTLLHEMTEQQWDMVLGVNLKGVFLCCRAVLPAMIAKGKGRIVNVGSVAGLRMTFFGSADYTAAKHGVTGLTQHLAWEVADHNVTVNTICPGGVMTPLMEQGSTPEFREKLIKRLVPLGRFCNLDDIAEAAVFLASDKADMITGQMLAVDGGLMTGFGEDLRPIVRKRMADEKAAAAAKKAGHK
ncbi:MAG TPA: SDR family NAD(P)-dependent oxidoreductase [Thermoanaerobaculia bacterium]|nr:SDR family NAD(P)-dependent oxidoreductase [Thermoanaerobaculia bacterium]HQR65858.1 SDR family NAD(P)-dependent oxidoreductase [Thermoanaerobaculia bacterium]